MRGVPADRGVSNVLVPLDGTPVATLAVPWADQLAQALGASVTLIHVDRPGSAVPTTGADGAPWSLSSVRGMFETANVRTRHVFETSPAEGIAAEASSERDLIVMVSHVRHGLQRVLDGRVASEVIRTADVPVLILPPDVASQPPRPIHKVLVPLDGSDLSAGILGPLIPLARKLDWALTLLGVAAHDDEVESTRGYLDQVGSQLHGQLVACTPIVLTGQPTEMILRFAAVANVDLIAMCTRSRPARSFFHFGGVTEQVLDQASLPMLVMHPTDQGLHQSGATRLGQTKAHVR